MDRLKDKVAIVTGGASGIGAAIVRLFAQEGAAVMSGDIQDQHGREVVKAAREAGGVAEFTHVDVSNPDEVARLVDGAVKSFGRLDVMVANAGMQLEKAAAETSVAEWDRVINVNLKGTFLCCKQALAHMLEAGGGSIIIMGSVLSTVAEPKLAAYCASKGGVLMLARSIATDYGRRNIRVNCICPGYIDTPLGDEYFIKLPDPQAAKRAAGEMHLLGRMGTPQEVAKCALFLATDDSSFVTGSALVVDGGLIAKV